MKTVKVVVLEDHVYGSIKRKKGDVYEADPRFLTLLTGLKRVKVDEIAEPVAPVEEPVKAQPKRNEYRRRDMKAEQ